MEAIAKPRGKVEDGSGTATNEPLMMRSFPVRLRRYVNPAPLVEFHP